MLDTKRCERNIQSMLRRARQAQVTLRPHFKTHQSIEVGRWMQSAGIEGATVSSLRMAKYFADGGWKDITVAFPVNVLEMDTINELAQRVTLNLLVLDADVVRRLEAKLTAPVNVFIKMDTGYHRTGIPFDDFDAIDGVVNAITIATKLHFKGFLHHAGHSYDARSVAEIAAVHQDSLQNMQTVYARYVQRFPNLEISVGDTPTCSVMNDFGIATEIRPGNFVFYDLMMVQIGACTHNDIAVAMACPVVAKHLERREIIIYGGGVHFSKDVLTTEQGKSYGQVVVDDGELGWGNPLADVYVSKLSQEHGTISAPFDFVDNIQIGDIIKILPVHSCMTADLMRNYLTTNGNHISTMRS